MVEGAEIASSARAGGDNRKYAGYFSFSARVKGDATPEDLEQAWYAEVERLKEEPVSDTELQRVKNQVAADSYRSLRSNSFIRIQLGIYEAMGGWEYVNEAPQRLMAVTARDIQRVANEYFVPENRSVAVYTRRADAGPVDAELMALAPELREQAEMMMAQFASVEDPAQLRMALAAMEGQKSQVPEEYKPMFEYVVKKLAALAAELEEAGDGDEEARG